MCEEFFPHNTCAQKRDLQYRALCDDDEECSRMRARKDVVKCRQLPNDTIERTFVSQLEFLPRGRNASDDDAKL